MVYFTIRISPASQDMTASINEFGKFIYNRLHMAICASGDIFQADVDNLLCNNECVKTDMDDIIVLSKDCFRKHIKHMIMIFIKLRASGLKFI